MDNGANPYERDETNGMDDTGTNNTGTNSPDDTGMDDRSWIPEEAVRNLSMERSLNPSETEEELTRRLFRESAPQAAMSIIFLAIHGTNERVRLDADKYVVERVLGKVGDDAYQGDKSPLESLLNDVIAQAEEYANTASSALPPNTAGNNDGNNEDK